MLTNTQYAIIRAESPEPDVCGETLHQALLTTRKVSKHVLSSLDPTATILNIIIQVAQVTAQIFEKAFSASRSLSLHIGKALPWLGFVSFPASLYILYSELTQIIEGSSQEQRLALFRFLSEVGQFLNYLLNCGIALTQVNRMPQSLLGLAGPFAVLGSILSAFGIIAHYQAWQEASKALDLLKLECHSLEDYRRVIAQLTNFQALERGFIKRHFCSESKFEVLYGEKLINQFEQALQSQNASEREMAEDKMHAIMERLRKRVQVQVFSEKLQTTVYSINLVTGTVFALTPFVFVGIGLGVIGALLDLTQSISRYVEKKRFENFLDTLFDEPMPPPPLSLWQRIQGRAEFSLDWLSTKECLK